MNREQKQLYDLAGIEQHLLAEFRAHHLGRQRRRRVRLYFAPAAALLIAVFAVWGAFLHRPDGAVNAVSAEAAPLAGFVPLPYAESGVPLGDGVIVRVQLTASDLNVLGVPALAGAAREPMRAEVLIGQDGVARAVRFVP